MGARCSRPGMSSMTGAAFLRGESHRLRILTRTGLSKVLQIYPSPHALSATTRAARTGTAARGTGDGGGSEQMLDANRLTRITGRPIARAAASMS